MSGQSTKRQKITALASAGVPDIASLPPELLETVCGFLDVGTLCTARLVCTQLHGAASRCIHSVELSADTLRSQPETNFDNFPNLSRVTIFDAKEDDLLMLAQSPVADAVTHLQACEYLRQVPQRGRIATCSPVMPLLNLMSLDLDILPLTLYSMTVGRPFPYPQTLRELNLDGVVTDAAANLVTRLTNLTCLRIDTRFMRKPFEAVTALTALQRLEMCTDSPLAPFVAQLTLLTHLKFTGPFPPAWPQHSALASLTRLHRLVHLGVGPLVASSERQLLASMAAFTSLRSLDLDLCRRPERSAFETACMTPLSRLTALRLESGGLEASFLPRFNLERLQDLSLSRGVELDRDGVAALGRATGLTRLQLQAYTVGRGVEPEELRLALSCLLRLRALSLETCAAAFTCCSEAIALLGELTNLEWTGQVFNLTAAAEVCLGLRKLRVLELSSWGSSPLARDHRTHETFLALAKLPELRMLEIFRPWTVVGWSLTDFADDVRAHVDPERHDKGWPPLKLYVG